MIKNVMNKSIKNIMISFAGQLVLSFLGLILPRLLIIGFGSEVNGFFTTVTQVYTYLEVLRAGVGMATIQALYKPIVTNDSKKVSTIISTSKKYFERMGYFYLIITVILAFVFALSGNESLNRVEIISIVLLQGITGWISFSKINWFIDLLRAEGKNYVFTTVQTIGSILIKIAEIALILITQNPVLIKSVGLVVILLEYLWYTYYRRTHYENLNLNSTADLSLLKNRKSYLIFHISSLINSNTDIVIISFFLGYAVSSVYSIFFMIVFGINAIVNTFYSSTSFVLGHSYQRGIDKFTKTHDIYYLIYITITSTLFSVCYLLIIPFIKLYTRGITDINYIVEYLPLLFCLIQILTCGKNVGEITVNIGGLAKKVAWRSILEAALNLVISIILVQFIGIYGVLVGTIIALLYRVIDVMIFSNRKILNRKPWKNFAMLSINLILFFIIVWTSKFVDFNIDSYLSFFVHGLVITPIIVILFFIVSMVFFRKDYKEIFLIIKSERQR